MSLQTWLHTGPSAGLPLSRLDWALAQTLQDAMASDDAHHLWLAALTSHQWSRGHACLDLHALRQDAAACLGWTPEQVARLPVGLTERAPEAAAHLPWCQGEASPLVYTAPNASCATSRLYLRRAWQAEQTIRHALHQRVQHAPVLPSDLSAPLDALFGPRAAPVAGDGASDNTDWQRVACETAARRSVCLITGGPGTGKTTTVVRVLALLLELHEQADASMPLRIHLAAPTGKAAARLTQSIRAALVHMPESVQPRIPTEAQTLHRLLRMGAGRGPSPLATDVVVVDEASMIDLEMMARLVRSVPLSARLVLLGDRDQLASVEAGAVMAQLCELPSLASHLVTLRHSHRFDAQRGIGQWAQAVNTASADATHAVQSLWAHTPTLPSAKTAKAGDWPDVTRLQDGSDAELAALVQTGWRDWRAQLQAVQEARSCSDSQAAALLQAWSALGVLCATREGPQGVTRLIARIERALQLPAPDALGWYVGRPVMVTRNDYALDLMNGDMGLCLPHTDGSWRVAFAADEGGVRWFQTARLSAIETTWAMTVHKSQGSEWQHVLLALPREPSPVLTRELVYTGLTRARQRLTIWAPNPSTLAQACARRVQRSGGLADPE